MKPEPFRFPKWITTKKDALAEADKIFPAEPERYNWWEVRQLQPLEQYRRLHDLEDRLRAMLEWLYDDDGHMRIYKAPRTRHFWYRIAQNLFWNIKDAHTLIELAHFRKEADKKWARYKAANIMKGDGEGI